MSKPTSTRPPVDEDVDDLDDVLDQFTPAQQQAQKPPPTGSATAPAAHAAAASSSSPPAASQPKPKGLNDLDMSDDFARELAEGMASLMREIAAEAGEGPGAAAGAGPEPAGAAEKEREDAFRRAWEAMLVEGMDNKDGVAPLLGADKGKGKSTDTAGTKSSTGAKAGAKGEEGLQDSIKRAMERMRESDAGLHDGAGEEDTLEALLKSLGEAGGEGGASEDQLQGLLEGMMTQLMSKEVLYEPLKELHEKFPEYMKEHGATLKADDKKRFEGQQTVVAQIVAVFEDPTYSPDNVEQGIKVVTLMNEMQSYGSPPSEIMGPLPAGLELGPDGLPKLPDGCVIA